MEYVYVGRINGTHGLKGELKLISDFLYKDKVFNKGFNFFVGNCDSHGKNYSILYKNGLVQLAPIYDVVSTCVYSGLTDKLLMKIGNHFELGKVTKDDFVVLCGKNSACRWKNKY